MNPDDTFLVRGTRKRTCLQYVQGTFNALTAIVTWRRSGVWDPSVSSADPNRRRKC